LGLLKASIPQYPATQGTARPQRFDSDELGEKVLSDNLSVIIQCLVCRELMRSGFWRFSKREYVEEGRFYAGSGKWVKQAEAGARRLLPGAHRHGYQKERNPLRRHF